jgi:glycosyltransferase involved in cell wall biosynthesis
MKITVAICCFNSEEVLPNTLKTLRKNTPAGLNIIVVDDGSTDDTVKIATAYETLVISHTKNMGYAQARQSAIQNCDSEILAFIDDSCLVTSDWFSTLENLWANVPDTTKVIAGLMEINQPQSYLQKFQSRHNPFLPLPAAFSRTSGFFTRLLDYLKGKKRITASPIASFSNGNVSFRVIAANEIGGYDLRYSIGAEDEDFASRIISHFGKSSIYFDPSLVVFHASDGSIRGHIKRAYKYGRSSALRYRIEGGLPTIMPIPALALVIIAFEFALKSFTSVFLTLVAIPLFYAGRSNSTKFLISDGYLLFLSEFAHLTGFLQFFSSRKKFPLREMSSL